MSKGPRRKPPFISIGLAAAGIALVVLAYVYGAGCNFDTADVCHPFGVVTQSAWDASAMAGLLGGAGGWLFLMGVAGLLLNWLRGFFPAVPGPRSGSQS